MEVFIEMTNTTKTSITVRVGGLDTRWYDNGRYVKWQYKSSTSEYINVSGSTDIAGSAYYSEKCTIDGLESGTKYTIKAYLYYSNGELIKEVEENGEEFTTDAADLEIPTVNVTRIAGGFHIDWEAAPDGEWYRVRCVSEEHERRQTLDDWVTEAEFTNLYNSTTYTIYIDAYAHTYANGSLENQYGFSMTTAPFTPEISSFGLDKAYYNTGANAVKGTIQCGTATYLWVNLYNVNDLNNPVQKLEYEDISTGPDFWFGNLEPGTYVVKAQTVYVVNDTWIFCVDAYGDTHTTVSDEVTVLDLRVSSVEVKRVGGGFNISWEAAPDGDFCLVELRDLDGNKHSEVDVSNVNSTFIDGWYGETYQIFFCVGSYKVDYGTRDDEGNIVYGEAWLSEQYGFSATVAPSRAGIMTIAADDDAINFTIALVSDAVDRTLYVELYNEEDMNTVVSSFEAVVAADFNSSTSYAFDNLEPGTYVVKSWTGIYINNTWIYCVDGDGNNAVSVKKCTIIDTSGRPWVWDWSATTQRQKAYSVIEDRTAMDVDEMDAFSYAVWDEFVDKVAEFMEYKGWLDMNLPSDMYGFTTTDTYRMMLEGSKTKSSRGLTVNMFNAVRYCIGSMNTFNVSVTPNSIKAHYEAKGTWDMQPNEIVYGAYFLDLAEWLNGVK